MKKSILFSFLLFLSFLAFAQIKIENPIPSTDIKVKRCFANGNGVIVDLIINNYSNKDLQLTLYTQLVIDDEGISYDYNMCRSIDSNGEERIGSMGVNIFIPKEGFSRYRTRISDVSDFAASLQYLRIAALGNSKYEIIVRNIPIDRD